ncbi:MAG: hypothetical protein WCE45_10335 [Sedimentisphaerales bacterium]
MKARMMLSVVLLGVILSILAGCVPTTEVKLNLAPQRETVYKVVLETSKDYSFSQPSINKTKERHTVGRVEMVFAQKIESVDQQGTAVADITIKKLKYLSEDPQGKLMDFDSEAETSKSDPLMVLIGLSYKIKIMPDGKVETVDVKAARELIKEKGPAQNFVSKLFSDEEIARRHQVLALMNTEKTLSKKGDKYSTIVAAPEGMLMPKSFEKVYTLTDIKKQGSDTIAVVDMSAATSSKRAADTPADKQQKMNFFANMFDEKDNYTGKMVLNLTTGEIDSYQELLKAEWLAVEPSQEQKSDKGPDQLTMGFSSLFSIEKVK